MSGENEGYRERQHRQRILTDEDVEALAQALASHHQCRFTSEERVDIKRFIQRLNRVANAIGWVVLGLIGAGVLYFLRLGIVTKGN